MPTPPFSLIITQGTMGSKRSLSNFQMSALTIDRKIGEMLTSRVCPQTTGRSSSALEERRSPPSFHRTSLKLDHKRPPAIILYMRGRQIKALRGDQPKTRVLKGPQLSITSLMSDQTSPHTREKGTLTASRKHRRKFIRISLIVCGSN